MTFSVIEKLKEIAIDIHKLNKKYNLPNSGVVETHLLINNMSWRILDCKNDLYISGMEDENWDIDLVYNQETNTWSNPNE